MQISRRRQLALGLMLAGACATCAHVAPAADRAPTTAPAATTQPLPQLAKARQLVAQLADRDYERREAARLGLMGFKRADLPALREAVHQNLPLAPSQLAVLRDIVTQVYLSGDTYLPDENGAAFLGITMPALPEEMGLLSVERGVAVTGRLPGFCAYRMLQNGDVLLAVVMGQERVDLVRSDQLKQTVMAFRAGQTVTFEVLRQGRILTVPITLDARPFNVDTMTISEFMGRRADQAEEFWQRQFAPLLGERVI